ncbi:putative Zinc finger MYND domain-containing protein 12 [Monocercomonoides exilis]|uniref:putative Zinc finger MYND domain-containing protein 12 n=1 Tax=Monocercomonoides exilis TaxID=2049356 RepID=UPI00355A0EB7|nr:putative Zinc finger MYND domain-containing protein 12 [Monocercomonoides exilis]|eukprot:MONOS_11748.1-p1 / transcript=MONOS_11748.1 / gene=MONOS_11748 / organism=Monocercomonoides_exilis_PA203 / gene_product=Zinc finger MYND domain-containing protein 12 / transcript_product=Zinc finger MYND domain-containing protein 12 / location=Mono_scaffold00607:34284-35941(-) / protein_length=419 / sequence_SO=supercontig / SO=protein_coding / is_pseudo=false
MSELVPIKMTQRFGSIDYNVVNTLAKPRKQKNECEMCGKTGLLQCPNCRVTYYCTGDHALIDQLGIHTSICPLLKQIRTPVAVMGSERDRLKREHQKHKIMLTVIETSKREAMKHLVANEFQLAMAGALQAQRHSIELFGADRTELVPAYLLLAEASMGLESYAQAEGYLAKARYNVLEHPDCSNTLRSRLHRAWGRLMLVTGRVDEARQELAEDIYYSSVDCNPDHIETTPGYFHLANTFIATKQTEIASRIYDKVVTIWQKFLSESLRRILEASPTAAGSSSDALKKRKEGQKKKKKKEPEAKGKKQGEAAEGEEEAKEEEEEEEDDMDYEELLEDTQVSETLGTMTRIAQFREETSGSSSAAAAQTRRVMGLLYLYGGNGEEAAKELEKAFNIYRDLYGEECPECISIREEMDSYL